MRGVVKRLSVVKSCSRWGMRTRIASAHVPKQTEAGRQVVLSTGFVRSTRNVGECYSPADPVVPGAITTAVP